MRIELTIKTTYMPNWDIYEGIREIIQNGKDAETEFNAPLQVRHKVDTKTLIIENEGCTIPHEALLFGHTTKIGRGELIGKFGEGLKLGLLALVRAGYETKVRSGSEVWIPRIERSDKFDADVLAIYIESGRQPKERVQVEISNISKEEWDLLKPCFLFLNKKQKSEYRVDTYHGALLLHEKDIGKIYVKGIFVENHPKLTVGYDLTRDVEIDRDRKMIAQYDLEWRKLVIWRDSMLERKELVAKYLGMILDNAADIASLDTYQAKELPNEVKEQAVAQFKARHGDNAVPVNTLADSKDIEHLGKTGVIVNKPLKAILETILGTTEQIKAELANEVLHSYSWGDLSPEEKTSLEEAVTLVNSVEPIELTQIDVVDFRSESFLGMSKENRLLLAKKKLSDRNLTLETLVHEISHRFGGDGDHRHVAAMENIWSEIVADLRDKQRGLDPNV